MHEAMEEVSQIIDVASHHRSGMCQIISDMTVKSVFLCNSVSWLLHVVRTHPASLNGSFCIFIAVAIYIRFFYILMHANAFVFYFMNLCRLAFPRQRQPFFIALLLVGSITEEE